MSERTPGERRWKLPAAFPGLTPAQLIDFHEQRHTSTSRRLLITTLLASVVYLFFLLSDPLTIPDILPLTRTVRILVVFPMLALAWPVSMMVRRLRLSPLLMEVYFGICGTVTIGSQALFQALTHSPTGQSYFIGYFPTLVFYTAAVWTRFSITVVTMIVMTVVAVVGLNVSIVVSPHVVQDATFTVVGTTLIVLVLAYRREVDERTNYLLRQELFDLGNRDALTQLPNRRALEVALLDWDRGRSWGMVAMVDVDHFKALNDQFGHPAGDAALREIAAALRNSLRTMDGADVMRYGGEEFTVLITGISEHDAALVVERLRSHVAMARPAGHDITVSLGWSWCSRTASLPAETMIGLADQGVLQAKREGRDRAVLIRPNSAA